MSLLASALWSVLLNMTFYAKKITIGLLTALAILAFSVLYLRAFYYYPSDEVELSDEAAAKLAIGHLPDEPALPQSGGDSGDSPLPASATPVKEVKKDNSMRISIPKIKVDTKIQEVGLTSKGAMAAPRNFSEVGWYKYGTFPGKTGSAVMAGHIDNGIALPAVFKNLPKLEIGDDIYINLKDGTKLHFKVTGEKTYPYDSAPEEVFFDNSGKYLKLITCVGSIIRDLRTHSQRLVITAELVEG